MPSFAPAHAAEVASATAAKALMLKLPARATARPYGISKCVRYGDAAGDHAIAE